MMCPELFSEKKRSDRRKIGRCAEVLVRQWYENHGYEVLRQNLYLGHDELDLVIRKEKVVRVVEVRSSARRDPDCLAWSVPGVKTRKLKRAVRKLIYSGLIEDAEALFIDLALVRWRKDEPPEIRIWDSALSLSPDD